MKEVGGLVRRRVVGGWSRQELPKKNLGSGVGQKKSDKKTVARKIKTKLGEKIKYRPSKLTPGGQFHPIYEIP